MDYSYNTRTAPRKSPRRRRIILVCIVFAVLAIIGLLAGWSFSTNKAAISSTSTNSGAKTIAYKTYNGKFVTFRYSGGYSLKLLPSLKSDVEEATFTADTSYVKELAITVAPLPTGGLAADTGYYFRQTHPDLYYSQALRVAGSAATEWIRYDGTEQTIYIPNGNRYAVLAFSIAQTNDTSGLPSEVSALLQTFQWK
jgi:hypothetical protein